ncbi:MAG: hypothetical protein Q7V57_08640 [Actinomycetota bacterium]|nr:hypothetical protein [Actinomycetota bacterium]
MNNPRLALAVLAVAASGLAACSSDSKSIGPTSVVVVDATTTTVATGDTSPVTAPPVTPAPTSPPVTESTLPNKSLWEEVAPPDFPSGHTDPFVSSGVLADGTYWVVYNGGEKLTPDITVVQAYTGDECESQAVAAGDECLNGVYIPSSPSRDINDLPFHDNVYLTVSDVATQKSYWITPDELMTIRASSPSAGAPEGFGFVPFAFLMTVKDGVIEYFQQIWTP